MIWVFFHINWIFLKFFPFLFNFLRICGMNSQGEGEILAGASPELISLLREIVDDGPFYSKDGDCAFTCYAKHPEVHTPACPWRRLTEALEARK